jgi:Flp pilus assembly protein TadD
MSSAAPAFTARSAWLHASVALLAVAVYANTVGNGFVFDDRLLIEHNPIVHGEGSLSDVWLAPYHLGTRLTATSLYRPVTLSSFALDYRFNGTAPSGFHVVNILLNAVVAVLVLRLGLRLGLPRAAAWAGALLFAVHPVHTEAVANLAGRAELLAALFFLVALLAYLPRPEPAVGRAGALLGVAALSYLLAMLSKENAATLLGVVVAWEMLLGRRDEERWRDLARRRRAAVVALLAAFAAYLVLRSLALEAPLSGPEVSRVDNPLVASPLSERWATAATVAARYLALLVYPATLSADRSFAQIVPVSPWSFGAIGSGALLAALLAGFVVAVRRARRAAFLGAFAVISFSLSANFLVVIGTIMAERLLYLPSVAFCLLMGWGFETLSRRPNRRFVWIVLAGVLVAGSVRTVLRNRDWVDDLTLFTRTAVTSPRSVKVLGNLGAELARHGRCDEARDVLQRALAIDSSYHGARVTLAQCLLAAGDVAGAEREVRIALGAHPDDPVARLQLGEVLASDGRLSEAEVELRAILRAEPGSAEARGRLGAVLMGQGRAAEAEAELVEAVRMAPGSVICLSELGLLYQRTGRLALAVDTLGRAVQAAPGEAAVRNNLGNALREAGRLEESVAELRVALELRPDFPSTHYNLGLTYERAGRGAEARQAFERAVEIAPHNGDAHRGLGRLALAAGDVDGALRHLDEAIRIDEADVEAHALRARANFRMARYPEARAGFLTVIELNPRSVEARNSLGIIAALEGDKEDARRWWEEALEIAPDAATIRDNLDKLNAAPP